MESNQSTAEAVAANFPTYDWRTENRIKEYWDLYTLNDGFGRRLGECAVLLADQVYDDPRFAQALEKFGDFLILAQLPEPSTGLGSTI
jgi:hypothetical protein